VQYYGIITSVANTVILPSGS